MIPDIVVDSNVIFSALKSRLGPSHALLQRIGLGLFSIHLSAPLAFQYEDIGQRAVERFGVDRQAVDEIIDFLFQTARLHQIYYLWRPFLPDAGDDLVLELAVTARCSFIVTYNLRHFLPAQKAFGIQPLTPLQFLKLIGAPR